MENSSVKCSVPTNADSRWPYHQYYIGDKDQEQRRNGHGENLWIGAESLEWYTGKFVRDTMHGEGEYRWRYKEPEGTFYTYEGRFYGNRMHGYGVMSYPDGRVFNGIFYNNMRWGPGVESNTSLRENVGLWRGNQLVRLTWRPNAPSITLDFNFEPVAAKTVVEPHRTLLATSVRNIGKVNSAIELLKQSGAAPIVASEKWIKLYPKHCNDLASQVCYVELFEHEYYKNRLVQLNEIKTMPISNEEILNNIMDDDSNYDIYYAWNNSEAMVSMMKHCFTHEIQRKSSGIDLATILSGLRSNYKRAGKHEFDCRNVIMCSYLGDTCKVAELINEDNVHPDVTDMLGNTALMYATCGNQVEIIHFLAEAGANVNSFNDSCCTALSVALLRFACLSKDIPAAGMVQTLSPPPQPVANVPAQQYIIQKPSEWHITRQLPVPGDSVQATKLASKTKLGTGHKTNKSNTTIDVFDPNEKRRTHNEIKSRKTNAVTIEEDFIKTPEEILFNEINQEFLQNVTNLFSIPGAPNTAYLFDVSDMVKEIDGNGDDRTPAKPRRMSTNKDFAKTSPNMTTRPLDSIRDNFSISSVEREKILLLNKCMSTIVQLLSDGADPRLVRCPQPALFTAVVSGSLNLVRQLVHYGADVNEVYPDVLNYTVVDVAFSRPPTYDNLALVRTILECGGTVDHRLKCESDNEEISGPTLLHAVLVKLNDDITEEKICCELLELLLEYGCKPLEQFRGFSAIDMVMEKSLKIFDDIFVKSPRIDLNAIINENNQTILVKMFSIEFYKNNPIAERLQTLTNLLLYGADPLLECDNRDMKYANIFVFAKKTISDIEIKLCTETRKTIVAAPKKEDPKKTKKEEPKTKAQARSGAEDMEDYRQALYLIRDCVRLLHIRWIQAKLMRELRGVVEKFEHRHWNLILPEHKNKRPCGLWLSMTRCLEIWDIFKANKKRKCSDRRVLKHILCLVHFYCNRAKTTLKWPLTAEEREAIEAHATLILKDHKKMSAMETGSSLGKPFVMPELIVRAEEKFQICFECALPLPEDKILCKFCKQVSYCSLDCMKINIEEQNVGIHPCCQNLIYKYFPTPDSSTVTR